MGDMADDAEAAYYGELGKAHATRDKRERISVQMKWDYAYGILQWKDSKGGLHYITKMGTGHIINILKMLKGRSKGKVTYLDEQSGSGVITDRWIQLLQIELKKRENNL